MALNDDKCCVARFNREQLPDLLVGETPETWESTLEEVLDLASQSHELIAVWKGTSEQTRISFPQIVVGNSKVIEDFFAWSSTYMRGLGTFTSQSRVLSTEQLRIILLQDNALSRSELAGGGVGLVLGELLMHMGRPATPNEINLASCYSTLSFALIRAAALGAPSEFLNTLAGQWEHLRRFAGHPPYEVPADAVEEIARMMINQGGMESGSPSSREQNTRWLGLVAMGSRSEVVGEIGLVFHIPQLKEFSAQSGERTPEEKVKLFDQVAPNILQLPTATESEKAFAIAFLSFWCRPGFFQQTIIAGQYIRVLPEVALWLGALQKNEPMEASLSVGEGLGWQIARELFRPQDFWEPPRCQVALSELEVLMRGSGHAGLSGHLTQPRLEVEIYPGVVSFVRVVQSGSRGQQSLPFDRQSSGENGALNPDDALIEAEKSIKNALNYLQIAKSAPRHKKRGSPKKRR